MLLRKELTVISLWLSLQSYTIFYSSPSLAVSPFAVSAMSVVMPPLSTLILALSLVHFSHFVAFFNSHTSGG